MFYELFRWIFLITAYLPQLLFFKRKTYYEQGAPRSPWKRGGALVITNHFSFVDYFLSMFIVAPRKLNVVCSEYAYRIKFCAWGMRFAGGIEANRPTRSMSFVRESVRLIRNGKLVQIFPEGHNTPDGKIHEFKRSYILIAHRANAPIIPIVTDGAYHLFKRTRVIVGKPILLSDYIDTTPAVLPREDRERVNAIIHAKVLELREELERIKQSERSRRERKKCHA